MHIFCLKLNNGINKEVIDKLLDLVDNEKKIKILKYKRTQDLQNSLFSYLLAKYLIHVLYGLEFDNIKFKYNDFGKPLIDSNEEIYFNISHCDNYIVCALDNKSIGIDIERIANIDLKIVDRFFTYEECKFINSSENYKIERFYEIWTMKESYIKAIGMGLSMPLYRFSVISDSNTIFYNNQQYNFLKFNVNTYYKISVCSINTKVNPNISYIEANKLINELLKLWRN